MRLFVAFELKENMSPVVILIPKIIMVCPDDGGKSVVINRKSKRCKFLTVAPFKGATMFHTYNKYTGAIIKWVSMDPVMWLIPGFIKRKYSKLLELTKEG